MNPDSPRQPGPTTETIKADIEAAIEQRTRNDGNSVSVEVYGTRVTLRGRVHSWAERDLMTSCAWGSAGVTNVVDAITVAA